jgi:hypothetical protein
VGDPRRGVEPHSFPVLTSAQERQAASETCLLETDSSQKRGVIGWARRARSRCDFVAYAWRVGAVVFLPFRALLRAIKRNLAEWGHRFGTKRGPNRSYTTTGVCVPVSVVQAAISDVSVAVTGITFEPGQEGRDRR